MCRTFLYHKGRELADFLGTNKTQMDGRRPLFLVVAVLVFKFTSDSYDSSQD